MSLLDNLPHTATATKRKRSKSASGGTKDTTASTIFTGRACWQQAASAKEITEFAKRGMSVTDKVYFTTRPALSAKHLLAVTNSQTGQTKTYEVRAVVDPDASAGLGVLYKVMCEIRSTDQEEQV